MADPVTLALAKQQCSIHASDTTFDALLPTYIAAAVEYVENDTGHLLKPRTVTQGFDRFGDYLELTRRPVISVESVAYVDQDGQDQTVADFRARLDRNPARVFPPVDDAWPTPRSNEAIVVNYTAGYAADAYPAPLVLICLQLIAHWFVNRESVVVGAVPYEVQLALEDIRNQYRPVLV